MTISKFNETANNYSSDHTDWRDRPSSTEVHYAYLQPQSWEHWVKILKFVLTGGFGVEPNPHERSKDGSRLPEFRVTWPSPESKNEDYKIFFKACKMLIGTLNLDDEAFSNSTIPVIYSELAKSNLFKMLYSKKSETQNNSVQHHVETVPTLIETSDADLKERFILRMTAVFHDIGKAFDIGRDQVHYHALISSNILSWFLEEFKHEFVNHLTQFDKSSQEKVLSTDERGGKISSREEKEQEFNRIRLQITETIRLHHVLEQIDKGVLDLETVAQIFIDQKISLATYGLFAIADGSSVIPDNAKYSEFLINNVNHYFKLLNNLSIWGYINDEELEIIKDKYSEVSLRTINKILSETSIAKATVDGVLKIVEYLSTIIDDTLSRALLSLITSEIPEI